MTLSAPRSLLGQFIVLLMGVALVAAITVLWTASTLLHQTADHYQRELLKRQAAAIAAMIGTHPAPIRPVGLTNGMAFTYLGSDHRILAAGGPARPAMTAAASLDGSSHFFRRGAVQGYALPAGGGWIIVSQDDGDPQVVSDDIVRTFLIRFVLICFPIAALVPLVGAVIARRLTVKMRAVSSIAEAIGPGSFDRRLPMGVLPTEVEPLARATNSALDRLVKALNVQTAFAADVAHELRTPLAVVRLRADGIEDPAFRARLISAVDRMARVIGQLLALADLERPIDGESVVDLAAVAASVLADRAPALLSGGRSIALECSSDMVKVTGYREAITLALENLVDNAARHTRVGTSIIVRVGPGAQLIVQDDGDPISDRHFDRLKERLWRGDRSRVEGSGIGLSIVERIAHAHQGSLTVIRGHKGRGLEFILSLQALER